MNPARRFPFLPDVGLLIGRLAVGVIFIAHGWQKLTETGHDGVTKMFDGLGIPLPSVSAAFATWVELLGGVALVLGVLVPVAGVLLAIDMAGAFWYVHMDKGLFADKGGYEFVLALGAACLLLALVGSGRLGVDGAVFGGRREGAEREPVRT
jgi:putative oxidoreductase